MKISQDFKCWIGLHKYEPFDEPYIIEDINGLKLEKLYVSRCTNCGKMSKMRISLLAKDRRYYG